MKLLLIYYKSIMKLLLLFLCLPATSHGTQSSVNDLSGGHCNDTSKNVHMKIEVYVCNKTGGKFPRFSPLPKLFSLQLHYGFHSFSRSGILKEYWGGYRL